jgi:carboxyl-terminal processing protease
VAKGFVVDDAMMNDFRSYLGNQKIKIDEDAFKKDLEYIKAEIHYEIDVALFGVIEAQKNLIAHDPQAQYAFAQFPDALKLTELAKSHAGAKGH